MFLSISEIFKFLRIAVICAVFLSCGGNDDNETVPVTEEQIEYGTISVTMEGNVREFISYRPYNPFPAENQFYGKITGLNGVSQIILRIPYTIQKPGKFTIDDGLRAEYYSNLFDASGNGIYCYSTPDAEINLIISIINEDMIEGTFEVIFYQQDSCDMQNGIFSLLRKPL